MEKEDSLAFWSVNSRDDQLHQVVYLTWTALSNGVKRAKMLASILVNRLQAL